MVGTWGIDVLTGMVEGVEELDMDVLGISFAEASECNTELVPGQGC